MLEEVGVTHAYTRARTPCSEDWAEADDGPVACHSPFAENIFEISSGLSSAPWKVHSQSLLSVCV